MLYTAMVIDYRYKKVLTDSDLMLLGIMIEETTVYHNYVKICNDVFGVFNDESEKARTQLENHLKENFEVIEYYDPHSVVAYKWIDKTDIENPYNINGTKWWLRDLKIAFENGHEIIMKAESKDDINIFEKMSEYLISKNSYICINTGYVANEIKYNIEWVK